MRKSIFLSMLLISISLYSFAQSATLRFKLKKGEKYMQKMDMEQNITMMGMSLPQTIIFEIEQEVVEVKDGGTTFVTKNTIKRMYMKQDNPMAGTMIYDSDKSEGNTPQLEQALAGLKGKVFNATMDDRGNMTGDELAQKGSTMVFPEKPIKVGDTWTGKTSTNNNGVAMNLDNTYTLTKIQDGVAYIDVKSTFKDEADKEIGTQKGTTQINLLTGQANKATLDQDLTLTAQGAEMQLKGKTTIIITKVK